MVRIGFIIINYYQIQICIMNKKDSMNDIEKSMNMFDAKRGSRGTEADDANDEE